MHIVHRNILLRNSQLLHSPQGENDLRIHSLKARNISRETRFPIYVHIHDVATSRILAEISLRFSTFGFVGGGLLVIGAAKFEIKPDCELEIYYTEQYKV